MNRNILKVLVCIVVFNVIIGATILVLIKIGQTKMSTASEGTVASEVRENKQSELIINKRYNEMYTYDDMKSDLIALSDMHSDIMKLNSLAETADSRIVYDVVAGKFDSRNQYIVTASMHAREYITTKLVMLQLVDFLSRYNDEDVLLHIVPMVNPDGVAISQFGLNGINSEEIRNHIEVIAQSDGCSANDLYYMRKWKANANGVDLNRNFDALWNEYQGTPHPSSERYKGEFPGSEPEVAALIKLTQENEIKKTVSYHTMGEVIYWYFGQTGSLFEETRDFANKLSDATGYITDSNYQNLDPAGYKDWALLKLEIPSVTIEVGRGECPLDEAQIGEIYERNKNVFSIILDNVIS